MTTGLVIEYSIGPVASTIMVQPALGLALVTGGSQEDRYAGRNRRDSSKYPLELAGGSPIRKIFYTRHGIY